MNTVTGVVEVVYEKKGIHSVKMDNEEWYSFYKTEPSCGKGDTVTFSFVRKGNFNNADASSLTVASEAAPPQATSGGGGSGTTGSNMRQMSIELQSSRRDAIELVKFMTDSGAVKLPSKQADKYDALLGLISQVTYELYSWVETPLDFIQDKAMESAMAEGATTDSKPSGEE